MSRLELLPCLDDTAMAERGPAGPGGLGSGAFGNDPARTALDFGDARRFLGPFRDVFSVDR